MTTPTQPVLSLSVLSSSSLQGNVTGADPGTTNQAFYQLAGSSSVLTGPSIIGSGNFTISGLVINGGYTVWVVSTAGSGYSLPSVQFISLATTDSLKGALVSALANNVGFTSLCPQVWADEIPVTAPDGSEIQLPFAVVSVQSEKPNWNFEATQTLTNYYSECQATIEIFAVGADAADKIRLSAESVIDWQSLPFQTATTIQVVEDDVSSDAEWALARTGQKAFHVTMKYVVFMTRP